VRQLLCSRWLCLSMIRRAPRSTLCPYTTLFRSAGDDVLQVAAIGERRREGEEDQVAAGHEGVGQAVLLHGEGHVLRQAGAREARSEEHTSELQSRENLVCRLLLEKKKQGTEATVLLHAAHELPRDGIRLEPVEPGIEPFGRDIVLQSHLRLRLPQHTAHARNVWAA